jgi:hypothetical protein
VPSVTTTATAAYDESRTEIRWNVHYTVAGAPSVRLLRVEMRAFRGVAPPGLPLSLTFAAGGEPARPVPPGAWMDLEPAPRGGTVVAAWSLPVRTRPVRAMLRTLEFGRLEVNAPARNDDALITVVLDGRPGIEMPLAARLPAPSLTRVVVPRHALFFADRPGRITRAEEGEIWEPVGESAVSVELELVPSNLLLRSGPFAWVRGYLYRPNPGAAMVAAGLAALTLVLMRRSRSAGIEGR